MREEPINASDDATSGENHTDNANVTNDNADDATDDGYVTKDGNSEETHCINYG